MIRRLSVVNNANRRTDPGAKSMACSGLQKPEKESRVDSAAIATHLVLLEGLLEYAPSRRLLVFEGDDGFLLYVLAIFCDRSLWTRRKANPSARAKLYDVIANKRSYFISTIRVVLVKLFISVLE